MLWRQGFHINEKQISKLTDSPYFRTMMQINKNIFYELDYKDKIYICKWNKIWNKNHCLYWETIKVNHLRLYSIESQIRYFKNRSFYIWRYLSDLDIAQSQIAELILINKEEITVDMYENREAEQISIERAPFWLKSKNSVSNILNK